MYHTKFKAQTYAAAMTHTSKLLPCVPFMLPAGNDCSEYMLAMPPGGTGVPRGRLVSGCLQLREGSDKAGCKQCIGILAQVHSIPEDMLGGVGTNRVGIPL